MEINNEVQKKLAGSLTAETTELLPYLPYLLQDFWELGSDPKEMIRLIKGNVQLSEKVKIIDLGCGKGAVTVSLCKELGLKAKGIDILPEFIEEAQEKAQQYEVSHLCHFEVQDINLSAETECGYDIVILGAVGNVLGTPAETLKKLKKVTHRNGYILIDDGYLKGDQKDVKYQNYEYLTLAQWKELFEALDLKLVAMAEIQSCTDEEVHVHDTEMIRKRAEELVEKYPDKAEMFEGYVKSQEAECEDLEEAVVGTTWLLQVNK